MKKLLILLLAALMCAASAHADSTQRIDHGALPLDETWTDGQMRPDEYHYYPFTVEQAGKLTARVQELLCGAAVDEQRMLQEVALMADRSAIAEETVRLHSHFAQIRALLDDKEPVGRRLDFLVQELNREVNTISSKSQDVPITQLVIAAKAEIEKIREQVQNVE